MSRFTVTKLYLFIGLILFTLVFIWLINAKPILLKWNYDPTSACSQPLVILNPLRNREVEKIADEFLEKIKEGNYEVIDKVVPDLDTREFFKENESKIKIKSWIAGDRIEERDKISFGYQIEREYDKGCYSEQSGIIVEKQNGVWKVTGYSPIY